jgi:phosphatidate cytidylyltransferase
MKKRIIVSIIFIPVIVLLIHARFLHFLPLLLFVLVVSSLGAVELDRMLRIIYQEKKWSFLRDVAYNLCGTGLILFFYIKVFFQVKEFYILYISAVVIAALGALSVARRCGFFVMLGSFAYSYVCPLMLYLLRVEESGALLLYSLFLLGWFNDASAYFIGSAIGRTKGIVKISPNKSLEGYVGSFVLTVGLGALMPFLFGSSFPLSELEAIVASVAVAGLAPGGDLLESLIKRRAGVKDSSRLLPGLGGVLDVFDSIYLSAPVYYLVVTLFLDARVT